VRLNAPTGYEVIANYDAEADSAGNTFTVTFLLPEKNKSKMMLPESVSGVVKSGTQQTQSLGTVQCWFPGEPFEIKVTAKEIKGGELFRLRKLELRPFTIPIMRSAAPL